MALDLRVGYGYLSRGTDGTDGADGADGAGVGAPGADGADGADGPQGISPAAPSPAANGADYTGAPSSTTPAAAAAPAAVDGVPGRSGFGTDNMIISAVVVGSLWTVNLTTNVAKLIVSSENTAPLTVGALSYPTLRRIITTNTTITSMNKFNILIVTLFP